MTRQERRRLTREKKDELAYIHKHFNLNPAWIKQLPHADLALLVAEKHHNKDLQMKFKFTRLIYRRIKDLRAELASLEKTKDISLPEQ